MDTEEEQRNLGAAEEFMSLIYDPATSSAKAVEGLLAPDCQFFGGNMPQASALVPGCCGWRAERRSARCACHLPAA